METIDENLPKDQREEIIRRMVEDPVFRRAICEGSLYWFSQYYFHKEGNARTPDFHREILNDLQNLVDETYVIAAARGMGKSTLANLIYALWRILCKDEKFVIILSATQRQSDVLLENVRDELEDNDHITEDFGPVKRSTDQWGRAGLEVGNYDAKIIAGSVEQSIRSLKHRQYRPGLFILDDVEDATSVKSSDAREKLLERYVRDIVPAGSEDTKIVILGGILHQNSFVAHMKKLILEKKVRGLYREYPFFKNGACIWPERFPDQEAIDRLRLKSGSEIAWRQEYLLEVISTEDAVIKPEWLEGQDYDDMPDDADLRRILISVDPAVSEDDKAAFTAIVIFYEYVIKGKTKLYIAAHPVNERLSFHDINERIKNLYRVHAARGPVEVVVEGIAAQQYITQELGRDGIYARPVTVKGDKRERLAMAGAAVQAKLVYFHRTGCEALKEQLIGFGYELYKDLADAFSQGINELLKTNEPERIVEPEDIHYVDFEDEETFNSAQAGNSSTGIHFGITKNDIGAYTAIVSGMIFLHIEGTGRRTLVILPDLVNEKLGFAQILSKARQHYHDYHSIYYYFFTERMDPEDTAIKELERMGPHVRPMPGSDDGRARFIIAAQYIKMGAVRFPKKGCEDLIRQMINYGVEPHTELVDAMVYLILGMLRENLMTSFSGAGW